ncbi:MAG: cytochrome c biogenesis protein CcsA [Actinomycetota bacterium]|nr:cytochrome c biogenesis protein CcsA [Actinomycetota bacterium]
MTTAAEPSAPVPVHTGSRFTRVFGILTAIGLALLALLGLVLSPADQLMGDSVRLMYVHVPSAITTYTGVAIATVGSIMYLRKRSEFWDLVAASAVEIGLVFCGLTLVTGMLWGRPTWGVYWVWDARLTSTALLFLLLLGYLAVRQVPADPHTRSKRSAVVALLAAVDVPIVHYSVDWWRSLHQPASLSRLDPTLDGLMLFTLVFGIVVFNMLFVWLLVHRFRVEWLAERVASVGLDRALDERRAEQAAAATDRAAVAGKEQS